MALNDKSDRTITDLKATFFDLFRDHTGDIVAMIEALANGDSNNAVNIETSIFQRIILLNKTANSIDGLQKNVEDLALLKNNNSNYIKNTNALTKSSGNSATKPATSNSNTAATSTPNPNLSVVNTSNPVSTVPPGPNTPSKMTERTAATNGSNAVSTVPQALNTPSRVAERTDTINTSNAATTAPIAFNQNYQINGNKSNIVNGPVREEPNPSTQPTRINSTGKENSTIQKKDISPVEERRNSLEKSQGIVRENVMNSSSPNAIEKRTFDEPGRLFRLSDKKVKAILVNNRQLKNLIASRQRQLA